MINGLGASGVNTDGTDHDTTGVVNDVECSSCGNHRRDEVIQIRVFVAKILALMYTEPLEKRLLNENMTPLSACSATNFRQIARVCNTNRAVWEPVLHSISKPERVARHAFPFEPSTNATYRLGKQETKEDAAASVLILRAAHVAGMRPDVNEIRGHFLLSTDLRLMMQGC